VITPAATAFATWETTTRRVGQWQRFGWEQDPRAHRRGPAPRATLGRVRRSSPTGGWGPRPPRTGRRRSSAGPYSPGRRPPRRAAFVPSAARRRRRPDDATVEDLAQEALARTLIRWRRVRRRTNPAGYVYRVAFRLLARRWRRQEPAHLAADEWQVPGPQGEATTRVAVESVFDAMPPRRRLVATLCLVVGCSTAEAAKTVGIAEGTVRKHVEEARAALRLGTADA
jgi:RNA polymerase sigma factor (sigma-70 family)